MKTVGLICEFNPFHNGHAYILGELRKRGADRIVCVMSGNFVQRGEPAIMPSFLRAEAAVLNGADLCVELPFPWSSSSAAYFAHAGMAVLKSIGADAVGFGSECCDIDKLVLLSEKGLPPKGNAGSAGIAGDFFGEAVAPNDILAAEYIKQSRRLSWNPEFIPVKRAGCAHDSPDTGGDYLSASAIRKSIYVSGSAAGLPQSSAGILSRAMSDGLCPPDYAVFERIIVTNLRIADSEIVNRCAECSGGVGGRIISAACACDEKHSFASLCATKKYTDSRLRRASLFALTGVTADDLAGTPGYVRLLAANSTGRGILYENKGSQIKIVTKEREIPDNPDCARRHLLADRADALYGMLFDKRFESSFFAKTRPAIV